ncbi:MAG: aminoacyl-tRNA hydrolase [Ruminococcus sp.]|nr:aminoacyl-tRNA hydrolase [Ruminococcus sp.]MBQ1535907.1 aminoacyl-tRNA hydrolase [Ruminococcus sp.]MBQ4248196.1 aminoacyl-tRNA hydrolase [Ruminococcus sp.]
MDIFEKLKALSPKRPQGRPEFIIAGLGNPGVEYEKTRHNTGFMAVDALSQRFGFSVNTHKFNALIADTVISDKRCLVMKPLTYMNKSGEAISDAMDFYNIPPENIIVIFDDISLDVGKMRLRRKGSSGGHNGIKSIIHNCGSQDFPRIKIGVGGKPHPDYDLADWVLSSYSDNELKLLGEVFDHTARAVELILRGNINQAMNDYN